MKLPEQRGPSRQECHREVAAWWQKHRSAPNRTAADLAFGHADAWLGLLWDQMSPEERAEAEAREVNEAVAYG